MEAIDKLHDLIARQLANEKNLNTWAVDFHEHKREEWEVEKEIMAALTCIMNENLV